MFDVNIKGAFHLIKESFPHMEKRKGSNIVLISSYAGYTPNPSIGFYSITKTMLVAMNKILGRELSKIPVRVNCVAPGLIKTKFSSSLWEGREKEAKEIMGVDRYLYLLLIFNNNIYKCYKDWEKLKTLQIVLHF